MANQAVDERGGQTVVPEYRVPLGKLQIGRNDEAFTLVEVRDDLKEQFGSVFMERNDIL